MHQSLHTVVATKPETRSLQKGTMGLWMRRLMQASVYQDELGLGSNTNVALQLGDVGTFCSLPSKYTCHPALRK